MKKIHNLLLVLAALFCTSINAEEIRAITNPVELTEFAENYYLTPRPDLVESAFRYFISSDLVKLEKKRLPLLLTFSCIFSNSDASHRDEWLKNLSGIDQQFQLIIKALFEYPPEKFLNEPTVSPLSNDMNWACFFASGKTKYLDNIIETLKYLDKNDELELYLTGASAKWSLSSNSRKHIRVQNFIETIKKTEPPEIQTILKEIIDKTPEQIQQESVAFLKEQRLKGVW